MASSTATISTEDIGFEADILREEIDMRLVDIEDWETRPEKTEEGEIDLGVEISVLELLKTFDAMACEGGQGRKKRGKKALCIY